MIAPRAFILGASSTIGRVLRQQARGHFDEVICTAHAHPFPGSVAFALGRHRLNDLPGGVKAGDVVFLLAGATSPNWVFAHPQEAVQECFQPLHALVEEGQALGAKLVFYSSELVFDGRRGGYCETDAVSPTTRYGEHKVQLERGLLKVGGTALVIRTGALVTDELQDNCVVRKTYESLGQPGAGFAEDALLSLTHVADLVRITLALLDLGQMGLFHVAGSPISRLALARQVAESSLRFRGLIPAGIPFSSLTYPEPRPRLSWLDTTRLSGCLEQGFGVPDAIIPPKVALLDASSPDLAPMTPR